MAKVDNAAQMSLTISRAISRILIAKAENSVASSVCERMKMSVTIYSQDNAEWINTTVLCLFSSSAGRSILSAKSGREFRLKDPEKRAEFVDCFSDLQIKGPRQRVKLFDRTTVLDNKLIAFYLCT